MKVLAATRKDITTGCTVRMELARRSNEKGLDALFKRYDNTVAPVCTVFLVNRLGEAEGIQDFVDRVYDLLIGDKRMAPYFEGKDIERWVLDEPPLA